MTYADIIVDISHEKLDKSFQYLVPEKLKEEIQVGVVTFSNVYGILGKTEKAEELIERFRKERHIQ